MVSNVIDLRCSMSTGHCHGIFNETADPAVIRPWSKTTGCAVLSPGTDGLAFANGSFTVRCIVAGVQSGPEPASVEQSAHGREATESRTDSNDERRGEKQQLVAGLG